MTDEQAQSDTTLTGNDQDKNEQAHFTQEQVDKIVKERLDRASRKSQETIKSKYGDYDALKEAAGKLAEIEDANKSETEKTAAKLAELIQEQTQLQGENARLAKDREQALVRSAVVSKATQLDFQDPTDAYRMLDLSGLELDGEEVKGIEDLLQVLAEAKPYLLRKSAIPRITPTNPGAGNASGNSRGETREAQAARLSGIGAIDLTANGGGLKMPSQ